MVMAIIAGLAALLLPALSIVKQAAQGSRCANSLRNLQLGNLLYSNDFDGSFLPAWYIRPDGTRSDLWPNTAFMTDYCEGGRAPARLCPRARPDAVTPGEISNFARSYGMNPGHGWTSFPPGTYGGFRASWGRISEVVAYADALSWLIEFENGDATNYWIGGVAAPEGLYRRAAAYRHRGQATVVMFDGHTERLAVGQLGRRSYWWDNN